MWDTLLDRQIFAKFRSSRILLKMIFKTFLIFHKIDESEWRQFGLSVLCICICLFTFVYLYSCIYICVFVFEYLYLSICNLSICILVFVFEYLHLCIYISVFVFVYSHLCICIWLFTFVYLFLYLYLYKPDESEWAVRGGGGIFGSQLHSPPSLCCLSCTQWPPNHCSPHKYTFGKNTNHTHKYCKETHFYKTALPSQERVQKPESRNLPAREKNNGKGGTPPPYWTELEKFSPKIAFIAQKTQFLGLFLTPKKNNGKGGYPP